MALAMFWMVEVMVCVDMSVDCKEGDVYVQRRKQKEDDQSWLVMYDRLIIKLTGTFHFSIVLPFFGMST